MISSSTYCVLSKFPSSFPLKDNHRGTCGMYSLKAVIEWYNGSQINNWKHYASNWISKKTGFMFPRSLMKVLRQNGLNARRIHCRWMNDERKIDYLKRQLKSGPVILLIAHAYNSTREFSFRRAFMLQHYITLRWYDDEKKIFFVYDSNTKREHHKSGLPVWNIILSYDRLLMYWTLGWWSFYRNFWIAVQYN